MVKRWTGLLAVIAMLAASCSGSGKYPLPVEKDPAPVTPEEPQKPEEPQEPEEPETPQDPEDPPVDRPLMAAFLAEFDTASVPDYLVLDKPASGPDFHYFPGFPSLTATSTNILLLRLLPTDAAGTGPYVLTRDYVHFGSFAVRLRLPDVSAVQPNVGATVCFGPDGVEGWDIKLASPTVGSYNTSARFCILGIDWTADKITYWVKTSATGNQTVIREVTEDIPQQPGKLLLQCSVEDQAPKYPYEVEIDWLEYSPFDKK